MNTGNRADVQAIADSRQPFMLIPIVNRSVTGPDVVPVPGVDVISTHGNPDAAAAARAAHATPHRVTVLDAREYLNGMHWHWVKKA